LNPHRAPSPPDLDLAGGIRRPSALGWLLLAFGVIASAGVLHEYDVLENRVAEETRALTRARRMGDGGRVAPTRPPPGEAELKPALAVARVLNRDWQALLSSIGNAAADPGVALLEVEQDGAKGSLKIAGEARTLPEVFAFAKRLEVDDVLREVRLSGYTLRRDGPTPVIGFSIQARWEVSR
jgi:hypothetical protein